jgi:hypothetical protein
MAPITKIVTIATKEVAGGGYNLSITNAHVRVRGAGHNWIVRWKSSQSFRIDFNYGASPFAWVSMASDPTGSVDGAPNVAGANPTPFPYTIVLDVPASTDGLRPARQVIIDPEVVVDDGTPAPHHRPR